MTRTTPTISRRINVGQTYEPNQSLIVTSAEASVEIEIALPNAERTNPGLYMRFIVLTSPDGVTYNADGGMFEIRGFKDVTSIPPDALAAALATNQTARFEPLPPAGWSLSLYVTDIVISSGAATAMNAFFKEGTTTVLGPYYLEAVAGRGVAIHFGTPKKITANTALTVTTSAAIAHSIDITGFTAPG